jgi:hypothetical protein
MFRGLLFAGTGVAWFTFWFITKPSQEMTASMTEWPSVIWFSSTLLALALALVTFGRMVGGRWVIRLATVAAAGVGLSSIANVVEDGFRVEAAFFAFILGMLILEIGLAGLTLAIAGTVAGRRRILAAIPAATLAGVLLFPSPLGGPLMLGAWLAASVAALAPGMRQAAPGAVTPGELAVPAP